MLSNSMKGTVPPLATLPPVMLTVFAVLPSVHLKPCTGKATRGAPRADTGLGRIPRNNPWVATPADMM